MSEIISIENISKKYYYTNHTKKKDSYGGNQDFFWALRDISLTLNKGDTLGIIGSNGSGKTTLLKILSQATAPTTGKVVQYGKLIPIIDIGSGFHPDISGRENIFLYGTVMLGMKKSDIQINVNNIIDFSELGRFIDEPIKNYSNGMYLRLALSVALFCKLDVLLLDEVFSVGDSAFMLKSHDKINKIIKQAATVILASHNMDDIMRFCNKCLWLEKGEIKMMGDTATVISSYLASNEYLSENGSVLETLSLHCKKDWLAEDAPQAPEFRLISVSIRNEGEENAHESLDYNLPIVVDIVYDKIHADCDIGFTLMLTDHYSTPLLATSHYFDVVNNQTLYGSKGVFRYTCTIPGQHLNLGIYKINIRVFLNDLEPSEYVSEVLTFRIVSGNKKQADMLKNIPIKFVSAFPWEIREFKE